MKVLLVEDDVRLAASLRRGLQAEGFSVTVTGDGSEGLWLAGEGTFDVLVLDVMLPGQDGFAVCAALRAQGDTTPILVLTARALEEDQTRALDNGADDYLAKPFSFAVLVARLRALLRRAGQGSRAPTRVGALAVDPRARRVAWKGRDVPVTTREFDLLEFLLRREGTVVSKRQILDGVWDFDFAGDPNIVEVYVGRLRRKLDDAVTGSRLSGPVPCIETVRGVGYRLVEVRP